MKISFRIRLFVITTLMVATVLAVVMMIGWSRVTTIEAERLDDRLCMEVRRVATQPMRGDRLADLESDIAAKLHLPASSQLMLKVDANDGTPAMYSAHWSASIDTGKLVWIKTVRQFDPPPRARNNPQIDLPYQRPQEQLQERPPERSQSKPERPQEQSQERPQDKPERAQLPDRPQGGSCSLSSFIDQGREWRAAKNDQSEFAKSEFANSEAQSIIAVDLAASKHELQSAVKSALTIVVPLALALSAIGAWLLSSLTMRPVNRLRAAMHGVTHHALAERLSAQGEDREFADLIEVYNTMLQRLETSFHQASRFSADAAHELRTPLTILQGRIEQAVNGSDHRAMQSDLIGMLDEVGRMSAITRKLLLLSRADAGRLALHLESIDLTALLDALIADTQLVVEDQLLESSIEKNLEIEGDALLIRQLFNNLISNAVRYCPAGGWIKVTAHKLPSGLEAAGIEVLFANRSHPILEEDRRRFFDRFYRGDVAHNRQIDGCGLGLSLAREIARAHGGDLTLLAGPADEVTLRLWFKSSLISNPPRH